MGGGQQATCLVAKQAVEFPQVLAINNYLDDLATARLKKCYLVFLHVPCTNSGSS